MWHCFQFLVVLFTFLASISSVVCWAGDGKMLHLEQSNRVLGKVSVYVYPHGVRVCAEDNRFVYICEEPDWDAHLFDPKRKVTYIYPHKLWAEHGLKSALSLEYNDNYMVSDWQLRKSVLYAGQQVEVYASPRKRKAEYWLLNVPALGVAVPGEGSRFLRALYDVPPHTLLPVAFKRAHGEVFYNTLPSEKVNFLSTTKIESLALDKKLFVVPAGLKNALPIEILRNNSGKADFTELFGE